MRWLLFLSRVAFVCNIFFLLAFSIRYVSWINDPDLVSTILILGWVFVFIFNPVVNICYFWLFISGNKNLKILPVWLLTSNIFFLVIEFIFIAFLNNSNFS